MHYSFNYGPVHFISIDTETGFPGAPEEKRYVLKCGGFGDQLTWLENDLKAANANRKNRPWIFVAGHHPIYQGNTTNTDMQKAFEDLFYKYGVDILFSGHVHHYERNFPTYHGKVEMQSYSNPRATTSLLVGGAGNDEMDNDKLDKNALQYDVTPKEDGSDGSWSKSDDSNGPWTAFRDEGPVGISLVTIVDDSTLEFKYIRTATREIYDSMTLIRDHSIY